MLRRAMVLPLESAHFNKDWKTRKHFGDDKRNFTPNKMQEFSIPLSLLAIHNWLHRSRGGGLRSGKKTKEKKMIHFLTTSNQEMQAHLKMLTFHLMLTKTALCGWVWIKSAQFSKVLVSLVLQAFSFYFFAQYFWDDKLLFSTSSKVAQCFSIEKEKLDCPRLPPMWSDRGKVGKTSTQNFPPIWTSKNLNSCPSIDN